MLLQNIIKIPRTRLQSSGVWCGACLSMHTNI